MDFILRKLNTVLLLIKHNLFPKMWFIVTEINLYYLERSDNVATIKLTVSLKCDSPWPLSSRVLKNQVTKMQTQRSLIYDTVIKWESLYCFQIRLVNVVNPGTTGYNYTYPHIRTLTLFSSPSSRAKPKSMILRS